MASKFYLMNEKAVRWPLNSQEKGIFTDPSGFGVEYDNNYLKVGALWMPNSSELKQPAPSGNIVFPVKPYETYQNFMNFINRATQLVLVYQPAGLDTEYFAEVDAVTIQKGGYSIGESLTVPVKFVCKSLFYTEEQFEYKIQKAEREFRWDFKWDTKFNDSNSVYFVFDNDGHVEAPFILSFIGYCLNPEFQVLQNGVELYHIKLNLEMQNNDRLTFSTFDDDLFIELNGADRKNLLDFTKQNFFKLPKGQTEIYFSCEAGRMNDITMSLEKYYVGV